jgi:tetratricopeptide (TPR) repeat protein
MIPLISLGFWRLKPIVYQAFYKLGITLLYKENSEPKEALNYFNLALWLQPNSLDIYYHRGWNYEKLDDFGNAKNDYEKSIKGGDYAALNQLARLFIIEKIKGKSSNDAIILLEPILNNVKENDVKYAMLKNLGWAHSKQNSYNKAKYYLEKAIETDKIQPIERRRAAAYCLLAELLESKNNNIEAKKQWKECLRYVVPSRTPEENIWSEKAHQRSINKKTLDNRTQKI